jgi:hypothetical protein
MAKAKLSFDEWMKQVDAELTKRIGLVSDDLPDQQYRDWYDAGTDPVLVAKRIIRDFKRGEL